MLHSFDSKSGLKFLTVTQILRLLDKIYLRLTYGTQVEADIAKRFISPAIKELKIYWNIYEQRDYIC